MDKIVDLESRLAFQEDLINSLNQQVALQQKDIQQLQLHLQHLNQKINILKDAQAEQQHHDERPPHY